MSTPNGPSPPDGLYERIAQTTRRALAGGALQPIDTRWTTIEDAGVRFVVRILANLAAKPADGFQTPHRDPLAPPYQPDLYVGELTASHAGLLNKFNVLDDHLLMVTRTWQSQDSALTAADFDALWYCLGEIDGLGFYNGGSVAGASQPHKHLQLVPLPLAEDVPDVPMGRLIRPALPAQGIGEVPGLPFPHAVAAVDPDWLKDRISGAEAAKALYDAMLAHVGLSPHAQDNPGAHNLVATRQWLMVVPRTQERAGAVAVNALGFAGALLVRDEARLDELRRTGPLAVLKAVAGAPDG